MAETVPELAAACAIFPSIPFGSSEGSLSFCAAVCRRRCTVDTSAGVLTAPFSHGPTLPLILEGATGGGGGGGGGGATPAKKSSRSRSSRNLPLSNRLCSVLAAASRYFSKRASWLLLKVHSR